jgi:hypothetical protein
MKKTITMIAFSLLSISLSAQVPTNGLVGWWPFNGNANDESGNGNNGVNNGATITTDRNGNANSAYSFSNSYINIPNSSSLQFNNQMSVSVWVNPTSLPNPVSYILSKGSDGVTPYSWTFNINNNGNGGFSTWNGGNGNPLGINCGVGNTTPININNWVNITATLDGVTSKIYINGVLNGTTPCNYTTFANIYDLKFGRMGHPTGNWPYYWVGKIDDIGIWNRPLTQQEITGLYNGTTTTCTDTVHVTVTDTLIINRLMTNLNPLTYQNTIKIYPNPANNVLNMNFGNNYLALNGYTLKITNSLSQTVYTTPINSQNTNVNISPWANGIYFVHLIDVSNNIVDIKKIVIQ